MSIEEVLTLLSDEMSIAFGGNALHRVPMSFVREIAKSDLKNLHLINTAGAHDVDLLCATNQVAVVDAGFVSYESGYGLANYYRKAVQEGKVKSNEHACYTVISALRAASYGVPFMPVRGLEYGDLIKENNYFIRVEDPFSGSPVTLVKALSPDVAVIHAHQVDKNGNVWIQGPLFDDILLARASKKVIITTEKIVNKEYNSAKQRMTKIPGFSVDAIIEIKNGSAPCSMYGEYDIDDEILRKFTTGEMDTEMYLAHYKKNRRW